MKRIKAFTLYNDTQQELLHKYWLPTFKNAGFDTVDLWTETPTDGNYAGSGYSEIIKLRADITRQVLSPYGEFVKNAGRGRTRNPFVNEGDIIIWSDVDVFANDYDGRTAELVVQALGDNDAAFARENILTDEVCCGFKVLRVNERTADFFLQEHARLVAFDLQTEQSLVNSMLRSSHFDLKWTYLPDWCQSCSYTVPGEVARIFHVNCTLPMEGKTSMQQKREYLEGLEEHLRFTTGVSWPPTTPKYQHEQVTDQKAP